MVKFEIGDKVRVKKSFFIPSTYTRIKKGTKGEVTRVFNDGYLDVRFEACKEVSGEFDWYVPKEMFSKMRNQNQILSYEEASQ
jgi:hypothetical protein